MRKINATIGTLLIVLQVAGQAKPLIDTGMLGNWPYILPYNNNVSLSADGHYVAYIIKNWPVGQATLSVQDLRSNWKKSVTVGKNSRIAFFSADSRKLCWQQGDSIWLQQAGSDQSQLLGVSRNISYPRAAPGKWVAIPSPRDNGFCLINLLSGKLLTFQGVMKHSWAPDGRNILLSTAEGSLKWLNLVTGKELLFVGAKEYVLSPTGENLLLMTEKEGVRILQWVDNKSGLPVTIWTGQGGELPGGYVYDKTGEQVAFHVRSAEGEQAIWYYKQGTDSAQLRADDGSTGFATDLHIAGVNSFSDNGRWLFFRVRKKISPLPVERVVTAVDIWSYRDEILNPAETRGVKAYHDYAAVLDIAGKNIQLLEWHEDERISPTLGNFLLLRKGGNIFWGNWWFHNEPESVWLVSLEDGKRKLIRKSEIGSVNIGFTWSPNGRWIYYWDPALRNYFVVNPQTGNTINLTASLPFFLEDDMAQEITPLPVGLVGWYPDDSLVLIYDNYDIWRLDPSGRRAPVNVTGNYGRQQGTELRLVKDNKETFQPDEELLLWGFNALTKHNGFFRVRLDKPGVPDLLTMAAYSYYMRVPDSYSTSLVPLIGGEGKNKRWIVMRQSATEYPNLFVSKDLKQFIPLTNLQPHKEYNWLTAEPVSWRMYNGQQSTGVLYKPENFDATKKYPVIFNYYEKFSQRCYQFPLPGLTTDNINIPWFVSRGYLVFTPDIHYTVASKPGGMTIREAAYNAVASAAEHLALRPYVDKNRMAIQGHSFGGQETVGIITQTDMFAAAAEVAGTVDQISAYLTLVTTDNREDAIEKSHKQDLPQTRMGVTPWEQPDLFRRNSPVLHADKITTPLMIVHNKKDGAVNFRQGVEMYMAMRRLGKPCWLLQYDNSGHVLDDKNDALDYTIRLTQYFDHHLKDMPAPRWMTGNSLAPYKGRNNLYGLDPDGDCCKKCKVCEKWINKKTNNNQQVTSLPLH